MWADIFYSTSAQNKLKAGQPLDDNERNWVQTRYQNYSAERPLWDSLGWNGGNQTKTSAPDPSPGTGAPIPGLQNDSNGGQPVVDPNQKEPFKNFNFYTGEGTIGDLNNEFANTYLQNNPGEAYRYAAFRRFGPLNNLSDNARNFVLDMERNALAGRTLRREFLPAGDSGKLGVSTNPIDEFSSEFNRGAIPYAAGQFQEILKRVFSSPAATDASNPLYGALTKIDSQGRPAWLNYALYALGPGSQYANYLYNNADTALGGMAGTKWLDYVKRLFPQLAG